VISPVQDADRQKLSWTTVILPWVPDLLGEEWTHECGIVIVGQNYGQFITGYTKRTKRMSAYDYVSATTWQAFQHAFVNDVVIDDNDYYELLAPLLQTTKSNARFIVTDLVRNTLVKRSTPKRRAGSVQRIDTNIDLNDVEHCRVYGSYADLPESKTGLWDRLTGTKAPTVVALGRAALCGLLRLFVNKGCTVTEHQSGTPWKYRGERWMYNCGISSVKGRLTNRDWHVVNSPVLQRSWHVVLVAHPATENNQYAAAVNVITAARAASGC
jgi:hypothetical protein